MIRKRDVLFDFSFYFQFLFFTLYPRFESGFVFPFPFLISPVLYRYMSVVIDVMILARSFERLLQQ